MRKIVFVSHCVLNTCSKVSKANQTGISPEDLLRKKFLLKAIENNIQLIQLPCPEISLYGSKRWGHTKDQFDNVFFKNHCRTILFPIIDQMLEYTQNNDRFNVLGIIGIEGSPSCGVNITYRGDWGGEFSSHENINSVLSTIRRESESGVMIDVLREMLEKTNLTIKIIPLSSREPELSLSLLD